MRNLPGKSDIWPLLILWTILNLWQAGATGLLHDEAYYWVYSRFPAFGYFDHPPGVAICILLGGWIPGEIGVRLLAIVTSTGILAFLFWWVRPKRRILFFGFLCSILLFHIGGFVMVPDIPLIALSCVYVILFERYREHDTLLNALLLAVVCALLMYSKYHAALLIIFAIIAHIRLLRRRSFWFLAAGALVLFIPHLWWQYTHDFITFRFHLFERGSRGFAWDFPLNYLYGQVLVYGPLIGLVMIASIRHWKIRTAEQRTHLFIVCGIFTFFLINSFRGRVEANWTAIAMPSLIFLCWRAVEDQAGLLRWTKRLIIPSVVIIIAMRVMFAYPVWNVSKFREVHHWDKFARQIERLAEGRNVAFRNSYQFASKYWFYSGNPAYSLNGADYRGNQFDLLPELQDELLNSPLVHFSSTLGATYTDTPGTKVETVIEPLYMKVFERAFASYHQLQCLPELEDVAQAGSDLQLSLIVSNEGENDVDLRNDNLSLIAWMRRQGTKQDLYMECNFPRQITIVAEEEVTLPATIPLPSTAGVYDFRIGFTWNRTGGKNSFLYEITLTD